MTKDTLKFYGDIYNPLFEDGYTKKSNRAEVSLEALARWQKKNPKVEFKKVLDVGCAWGKALKYWREKKAHPIGVDVGKKVVNRCKNNGYEAYVASATDLSIFEDKTFDLYMSTDVYEHLREEDLNAAIEEAKRVTKEYLLIRCHPTKDKRGTLHLTIWDNEKWKDFFESHGLETIPFGFDGSFHHKNTHFMRIK